MTVYFVDDEPDPVSPAMDELKAKGFKCILKSFEEFNQIFESKREEHGFVSFSDIVVLDMMNGGGETDPTGDGGNRILKDLWEYSCCPVIIYSSNPVLGDDRKHPFIHKIEKGKGSQKILLQCVENYMPFLNAKNDLISDLSHVFTDTLRSTAIALFSGATSQSVGEILIRLTRRRIAAVMDLGYNEDTKLQPYEQYIYPVLEKDWLQGDIIRNKETGDYALVLSPSCDLVVRKKNGRDCIKTETILCAHCVPFSKDKIANYFKPTKEVKGCANCDSCATNTEECKRSRLNEIHKQEEKQFCSLLVTAQPGTS